MSLQEWEPTDAVNVKCVAQNEDTCVVYGMPRSVVEAGVADKVVPLDGVTAMLIKEAGV